MLPYIAAPWILWEMVTAYKNPSGEDVFMWPFSSGAGDLGSRSCAVRSASPGDPGPGTGDRCGCGEDDVLKNEDG